MLEEIQNILIFDGHSCKFTRLCVEGNFDYAISIADKMNKEILSKTSLFQDFILNVKSQPEYVSKIRKERLDKIFEKTDNN